MTRSVTALTLATLLALFEIGTLFSRLIFIQVLYCLKISIFTNVTLFIKHLKYS